MAAADFSQIISDFNQNILPNNDSLLNQSYLNQAQLPPANLVNQEFRNARQAVLNQEYKPNIQTQLQQNQNIFQNVLPTLNNKQLATVNKYLKQISLQQAIAAKDDFSILTNLARKISNNTIFRNNRDNIQLYLQQYLPSYIEEKLKNQGRIPRNLPQRAQRAQQAQMEEYIPQEQQFEQQQQQFDPNQMRDQVYNLQQLNYQNDNLGGNNNMNPLLRKGANDISDFLKTPKYKNKYTGDLDTKLYGGSKFFYPRYDKSGKIPYNRNNRIAQMSKLTLFPHQSPLLNKWLVQSTSKQNLRPLRTAQKQLQDSLSGNGYNIIKTIRNPTAWNQVLKDNRIPNVKNQFKYVDGELRYYPQNKTLQKLWPKGMAYKQMPSALQLSEAQKSLKKSYVSPQTFQGQLKPLVHQMVQNSKLLGFVPHFGPISKNGDGLYIGAFVDPNSGRVRLPPKPSTKWVNNTDRRSMLQYDTLKAMYTWNSSMRALQAMSKMKNMSNKQWQSTVKQKRKGWNPLWRKKQQYKNFISKMLMGQTIYGIKSNANIYQNTLKVIQSPRSVPATVQKAILSFVDAALAMNTDIVVQNPAQFGKSLIVKSTGLFRKRPQYSAQKAIMKGNIIPTTPYGMANQVMEYDSVQPYANQLTNTYSNINPLTLNEQQHKQLTNNFRNNQTYRYISAMQGLDRNKNDNPQAINDEIVGLMRQNVGTYDHGGRSLVSNVNLNQNIIQAEQNLNNINRNMNNTANRNANIARNVQQNPNMNQSVIQPRVTRNQGVSNVNYSQYM